jgi:hypothetical protein
VPARGPHRVVSGPCLGPPCHARHNQIGPTRACPIGGPCSPWWPVRHGMTQHAQQWLKPNPNTSVPHTLTHRLALTHLAPRSHSSPHPPRRCSSLFSATPSSSLPFSVALRPPLSAHRLLHQPQAWVRGRCSPMFSSSFFLCHPARGPRHLNLEGGGSIQRRDAWRSLIRRSRPEEMMMSMCTTATIGVGDGNAPDRRRTCHWGFYLFCFVVRR